MVKKHVVKNELGGWVSAIVTAVGLPDPISHSHGHSHNDTSDDDVDDTSD